MLFRVIGVRAGTPNPITTLLLTRSFQSFPWLILRVFYWVKFMNMQNLSAAQYKTMSSLEISELTGKPHNDVLKDIRRVLAEAGIGEGKFSHTYFSSQNKELPCFNLPRRECDLVISGYSVKYRLAIIDRWQELESVQTKLPTTYLEALEHLVQSEKQRMALAERIESDRPKVEFAMAVRNLNGSCKVEEFAKVIGYGRNKMFSELRAAGYLQANNQPYQRYIDSGYFVVIENTPFVDRDGNSHPSFTTRITGKGQVALEKKFRKSPKNGLVLLQGGVSA